MFAKLLFLFVLFTDISWPLYPNYSTDLTVENHVLTAVNDKDAEAIRIYAEEEVTSIGVNAFDECSFKDIMISNTVSVIEASFPETLLSIHFTGSFEEIEFDYPNVPIFEYSYDEGFMNYWRINIRPNTDGASICNVSKEHYIKMKSLYGDLHENDKNKVDKLIDGTATIKDSIKYLDSYFSGSSSSRNTEREIPQSVMITLILIIASFGMTSIGIFYIFKDKNLIK